MSRRRTLLTTLAVAGLLAGAVAGLVAIGARASLHMSPAASCVWVEATAPADWAPVATLAAHMPGATSSRYQHFQCD